MLDLLILCGLSGSGKSTWASIFNYINRNYLIVNADSFRLMYNGGRYDHPQDQEFMVIRSVFATVKEVFRSGNNVILDLTSITKNERKNWLKADYGKPIRKTIVLFTEKDKNTFYRSVDVKGRNPEYWSAVINKQKERFQLPTFDEGFDRLWIVNPYQVKVGTYTIITR